MSYPWRQTSDPFKILITELLLRKTTRNQVSHLYERFFALYPNAYALSQADTESLEQLIRPLGMEHIRATALKEAAETVTIKYGRNVPNDKESLLSIPHVGPYVANAVLCFAYGRNVPLLDTNMIRVICRVFSFEPRKKRAREDPEMWKRASKIMPHGKARDFNIAMLDFAAMICTARNPKCPVCPILSICDCGQAVPRKSQD
jgi:A/G-specific adenine glycosylase